jgi:hypothetical protein
LDYLRTYTDLINRLTVTTAGGHAPLREPRRLCSAWQGR